MAELEQRLTEYAENPDLVDGLLARVRYYSSQSRQFSCRTCHKRKPAWAFGFDYRKAHDRADQCWACKKGSY